MVWRYFVPLSILVFDDGLERGPDSRLYAFCFHSGTPYSFQKIKFSTTHDCSPTL